MKYTVSWTESAVQKLAAIWIGASDRNAVTATVAAIDAELGEDPDVLGRATFDTVREYYHLPLGIEFEVIEADRVVHVLSVWHSE